MSYPLVSIVIPVFNRVGLIQQCIESALQQTYPNIEVVVSDNCSTDGTLDLVKRLALNDSRIRAFANPVNLGPVTNWLTGLERARGQYCKLLFSDDILHVRAVETLLCALEHTKSEIAFSSAIVGEVPWTGQVFYRIRRKESLIKSSSYVVGSLLRPKDYPVSPCAFLFYRERYTALLREIAYRWRSKHDAMNTGAGIDLLSILRYVDEVGRVAYIAQPLVFFRSHPESITIKNTFISVLYRDARFEFIGLRYGLCYRIIYETIHRVKNFRLYRTRVAQNDR
jgi:glycosyltransferase involved in cell wall biosynthesis